jgi:hypothetical protein
MSGATSRTFLAQMAEDPEFDRATENSYWRRDPVLGLVRDSGRMANRELVLRFCAFRACSIEDYRQHPSLDAFLLWFTRRIDAVSPHPAIGDAELSTLGADFQRAMSLSAEVLGPAAFRRWPGGADRRGPINRALFEAQANALADHPPARLLERRDAIRDAFRSAFGEPEYLRSVTVSTGDPNRVAYRLSRTREILAEVVG